MLSACLPKEEPISSNNPPSAPLNFCFKGLFVAIVHLYSLTFCHIKYHVMKNNYLFIHGYHAIYFLSEKPNEKMLLKFKAVVIFTHNFYTQCANTTGYDTLAVGI